MIRRPAPVVPTGRAAELVGGGLSSQPAATDQSHGLRACVLAVGLLLAPAVSWPAEPGISLRMTREELQRTWDLDRNGTIDKGEMAVAASKMRQERARISLRRIIDPVTGRLLDDDAGASGTGLAAPGAGGPSWLEGEATPRRGASREWFERWSLEAAAAESADPDRGRADAPSSDGRSARPRGLSLNGPIPGRTTAQTTGTGLPVPARNAERGTGGGPAAGGDALPATARPLPTGGLRAGAGPARPGYGSGVTRDLNAGRPIDRTAGAPGPSPATTGRVPVRGPAGPGAVVPGGTTAPRVPSGGRPPGRPYDPF